jgi:alkanesulfonate monooxygenase SsuD/methylene tetrahydromethanopterin reductase-like flavin-dependent oxidoreductase (luciferase family)
VCEPKPLQKPHPPIWIGAIGAAPGGDMEPFLAGREREGELEPLMTSAARYANVWNNTPISPSGYKQQLDIFEKYCHKVGRNFKEIEKSLETQVLILENEKEMESVLKNIKALNPKQTFYRSMEVYKKFAIIGTPERCIDKVKAYVELGVTYFIIWFLDFPSLKSIRLFAEVVIPRFK